MKLAFSMLFLLAGTAACTTSRPADPPTGASSISPNGWDPISLGDIPREDVRNAVSDLLRVVDVDWLWPEYRWNDRGIIVVVAQERERTIAYCVGICTPEIVARGGTSRVWRRVSPVAIASGEFRFMPLPAWGLGGSGDIVAVKFESREESVLTAVHEDFHLHYQSSYAIAFGDAIGTGATMSPATRASLETQYSRTEPTASELRDECTALVDALRTGTSDRGAAMAALRRFAAVREVRRARPDAPSGEEDFWERQEGVPTNLERRAAARLKFADRSAIATAVTGRGCETITGGSYFLVLGGLEAAILDTFADPQIWPHRVYPRNGTPASSLYVLVRTLSRQSEER